MTEPALAVCKATLMCQVCFGETQYILRERYHGMAADEHARAGSLDRGHRYGSNAASASGADCLPVFPAVPRSSLGAPGCRITAASSAANKPGDSRFVT